MIEYDENGVRRFNQDMQRAQGSSRSARDVFDDTAGAMAKGGLVIAGGFALAVKSAADFDKQMSAIKAVSGATGAEMNAVREKALQLGADTSFSASEAASAMGELIKAGISTKDVLGGAADAAVALAAAGEVDLKTAAELAANAMNQFALKASDLPRVADLIAGAANASAIDVGDFGQSLKQVGAVAHLTGLSFQDTAVAIAILGNAGIKGSDAGTSLKTMLMNLNPSTDKAASLMESLGIITKDGANQFFDAAGKAKSLADISQILQNALKNQTKEQKLATLNTLFGSDAIRAAAILTDQGAAGFNKMATSMNKVKAADVAKTRLDNLSGSVEQLKGSLETMLIQIGSGSQGPLKSFVDKLTQIVNWFNSLSDGTRQTIVSITLATGAFLLLGAAVIKTVFFFQRLAEAIRIIQGLRVVQTVLLNLRGVLFVVNGYLQRFVAAMGRAAVAAARAAATGIRAAAQAMARLAVAAARAGAQLAAQAARAAAQAAIALARLAVSAARAAASMALVAARATAVGAANFAATLAAGARAMALMAVNAARAAASMALMAARVVLVNAAMAVARIATLAWAAAMWLLNAATGPIGLIVLAIVALIAIIILVVKHHETIQRVAIAVWNNIKNFISQAVAFIVNFVKSHWQLLLAILLGPLGIALGFIIKYWSQIKSFISNAVNFVVGFIRNHWKLIVAIIAGPLGIIVALVIKYWSQIRNFTIAVWNAIWNFIRGQIARIKAGFAALGTLVSFIAGVFNRINSAVISRLASLIRYVAGIPGRIRSIFSNAGSWLLQAGRNIIQGLINGIVSMFNHLRSTLGSVTKVIPDWKGPPRKDKKLLTKTGELIMSGLIKGFENFMPEVQAALTLVTANIVSATAGAPALAASAPQFLPNGQVLPTGPLGLPKGVELEQIATAMANAMRKQGLGAVELDGQVISKVVGRIQGRTTSNQRRTR